MRSKVCMGIMYRNNIVVKTKVKEESKKNNNCRENMKGEYERSV